IGRPPSGRHRIKNAVESGPVESAGCLIAGEVRQRMAVRGEPPGGTTGTALRPGADRKSTRLNSSHVSISYAVFCLKKKKHDKKVKCLYNQNYIAIRKHAGRVSRNCT